MRLKAVRVTNFRSVEDSSAVDEEHFSVEQTTCLVGKNEAGKTAILQAIAGLNPHPATPINFDKERDYPRRYLVQYNERHKGEDAIVISTIWVLSEAEQEAITKVFGKDALTGGEIEIVRRYNSKDVEWTLPIDFKNAVDHLISEASLSAPERSQIHSANNSQTLISAITSLESPTAKQKALLDRVNAFPSKSITGQIRAILSPRFPRFMYFSVYDRMSGEVQLQQLKERKSGGVLDADPNLKGDRLFFEFLQYAGAPLDDILAASTFESFTAKLQAASNSITDQILDYWTQNPDIEVTVEVDAAKSADQPPFNTGTIGRARIYNGLHRVDVPFSERSAGFIWFFSFLVKFAQVKNDGTPIILLLDEPGLTLHGKAQADLLRYFEEKLAPHHQIIYSTHSPFMVPPDKLTSARIVEDLVQISPSGRRSAIGTKVREDVLRTDSDPDSIFPLQGALGYEITQTLFIGKHTLLVEGPSDILYLKALSAALAKQNRQTLDSRWTLCPSGGIGNIHPFVSLFRGNRLNMAVLTDYAKGDKRKIENLRSSEILRSGAVLTLDQFTGKAEADVEDLFEPDLFADLLNSTYQLRESHRLTASRLEAADISTPRIAKKAEAYFRTLPDSILMFDHYRPSEWLIEHPTFFDRKDEAIEKTLDRMEQLIGAINPLLVV